MKTMQKGFTLIELMIVVAIIGILAAIAIPAYQDYTQRAQVGEAVTLVSAAKTALAEYAQTNGEYPTTDAILQQLNIQTSTGGPIVGQYASFEVALSTGVITATMADKDALLGDQKTVGAAINAKSITFTPPTQQNLDDGDVTVFKFKCETAAADGIPEKYLPSSCK